VDVNPRRRAPGRWRRWALRLGLVLVVAFLLLQLVPYGWGRSNPPVVADVAWPSPAAAELARAACYDCHSNETRWPAYAYVAPMSWLVRRDVERGREELNLSLVGRVDDDAAEVVADGSMPPRNYQLLHREARLSPEERQVLVDALAAVAAATEDEGGGGRGGGRGRGGG
jgi:hypothetical protein